MPDSPSLEKSAREELTSLGFAECTTAEDVVRHMLKWEGTLFLMFNTTCKCAANIARPAIKHAIEHGNKKPDYLTCVLEDKDVEAVAKARWYIYSIPHSSPAFALFNEYRELVYFMPRDEIENSTIQLVSEKLQQEFNTHC